MFAMSKLKLNATSLPSGFVGVISIPEKPKAVDGELHRHLKCRLPSQLSESPGIVSSRDLVNTARQGRGYHPQSLAVVA